MGQRKEADHPKSGGSLFEWVRRQQVYPTCTFRSTGHDSSRHGWLWSHRWPRKSSMTTQVPLSPLQGNTPPPSAVYGWTNRFRAARHGCGSIPVLVVVTVFPVAKWKTSVSHHIPHARPIRANQSTLMAIGSVAKTRDTGTWTCGTVITRIAGWCRGNAMLTTVF